MEKAMGIVEKICGDRSNWFDEETYQRWLKEYPEYANEWIEKDKLEQRVSPDILRMKLEGKTYKVIAEKLRITQSHAQKIGKPLVDKYNYICQTNMGRVKDAAGDTRSKKDKEDFDYITDQRTINREMHVLVPRLAEIRNLINEG
jgi:hypothetical protein